jgi:hypothetical protein
MTRREVCEEWADQVDGLSSLLYQDIEGELRALWAREELLEAVELTARHHRCVSGCDICAALDALDAHDQENPR